MPAQSATVRTPAARAPWGLIRSSPLSRRRAMLDLASVAAWGVPAVALTACGQTQPVPGRPSGALAGAFDFTVQSFQPTLNVLDKVIPAIQEKHPGVKITYSTLPFGEMAAKAKAAMAAGSGPDGFHTYSNFWRGIDAANMMLPLTPVLFTRPELEKLFFANTLDTLYSKQRAVYMMPFSAGAGATMLLYHQPMLDAAGIDPLKLTTLDSIVEATKRLVVREGGAMSRAGLLPTAFNALLTRWIIDQGGTCYDEAKHTWSWQTAEAERALQWIVDLHDKHGVAWRHNPPEVKNPLGEGRAAAKIAGAFELSTYAISHPDLQLVDQPMPAFLPNKKPTYTEFGVSGWALAPHLKPDAPAARIGALLYRELALPDALLLRVSEYTGALLGKTIYADPRFKQTRFYEARKNFPDRVIARLKLLITAAEPAAINMYVADVLNGKYSVKSALAAMQQHFTAEEQDLRRNMT